MLAALLAGVAVAAPPIPEVSLGPDWSIVEESREELVLRHRRSADGLRIVLAPTDAGRWVGVAPIRDGRTLEHVVADAIVPVFAWPLAAPLSSVKVEAQGPDLLVRLEGPPLSAQSLHPDAPDDPVISWVRVRPRGDTWRIALRGVHRIHLPPLQDSAHHGSDRVLLTAWGSFRIDTDAPAVRGHSGPRGYAWDSTPSIDLAAPYPRTGITWTPSP